ncbi:MAG TPA: hypothetical protein PLO37_20085 [Candidatus Hydrogenedentes bacterium]|nr:hypothetical protein [Candidatus Hydrogenedentota bacterium]HPG69153.1 hypothetical protein [Candidatus Hydrogenedentota bacterium]
MRFVVPVPPFPEGVAEPEATPASHPVAVEPLLRLCFDGTQGRFVEQGQHGLFGVAGTNLGAQVAFFESRAPADVERFDDNRAAFGNESPDVARPQPPHPECAIEEVVDAVRRGLGLVRSLLADDAQGIVHGLDDILLRQ